MWTLSDILNVYASVYPAKGERISYRDPFVQRLPQNSAQELEQTQVLRPVHQVRAGIRVHEAFLRDPDIYMTKRENKRAEMRDKVSGGRGIRRKGDGDEGTRRKKRRNFSTMPQ